MEVPVLKRMELGGFKSFAQKTVLEFAPGITAIVGPNGSGKSNIIDAFRWILGEREARNLRGAKAEDLIFAGTPKKPRMGQAYAEISFSNTKNLFPYDVAEVTIQRKVDRSGASQYFINKSEVRLKDVLSLLAKIKLGARGLIVITQGNSDVFIKATPAERRAMIEEILGLKDFQVKKADAERKLKSTNANLEKVHALIEEILPHLRSLRRQVGRWEKREEIEKELQEAKRAYFGTQLAILHAQEKEITAKLQAHKRTRHTLVEQVRIEEAVLQKLDAQRPKEQAQLGNIQEKLRQLLEKRSAKERAIGKLEATIEIAATTETPSPHPPAQKLLALLHKIQESLEKALRDPETLPAVVRTILQDIQTQLGKKTARTTPPPSAPTSNHAKLHNLTKELAALNKEIAELRKEEQKIQGNQEAFFHKFREASKRLDAAKRKLEEWEREEQKILLQRERLFFQKEDLERRAREMGDNLARYNAIPQEHTSHNLAELERKILRLSSQLTSIGEIDQEILKEARETEERYQFLTTQSQDLSKARDNLQQLIQELDKKIKSEFRTSLEKINKELNNFFRLMFRGGKAKLVYTARRKSEDEKDTEDVQDREEAGIEINLEIPRKRIHKLEVLSGGEKSLVGLAVLFALIAVSPPPFLVLDETDAMLDEQNSKKFAAMLKKFAETMQFIIVTHNRAVMEVADVLYGVTMKDDGTTKIYSLKLTP
ncbi:hypothetical protein D6779_05465 [Candidatus Parcubacteria bacterium]|nr:MAG: hypothetical protein D6779_05465 [Candidatus Parcubacteria bacterium]